MLSATTKNIYTIEGYEYEINNPGEVKRVLNDFFEMGDAKYPFEVRKNGKSLNSFNEL